MTRQIPNQAAIGYKTFHYIQISRYFVQVLHAQVLFSHINQLAYYLRVSNALGSRYNTPVTLQIPNHAAIGV